MGPLDEHLKRRPSIADRPVDMLNYRTDRVNTPEEIEASPSRADRDHREYPRRRSKSAVDGARGGIDAREVDPHPSLVPSLPGRLRPRLGGASVFDVDGNRYLDLFSNGLSLIHGHSYRPVERSSASASRGTAWPGTSEPRSSSPRCSSPGSPELSRSGSRTPAPRRPCSAIKLARHLTERQVIVKAWHAYHGSYDDLEVGSPTGRESRTGRAGHLWGARQLRSDAGTWWRTTSRRSSSSPSSTPGW